MVSSQPRVKADGDYRRHPQRMSQSGVSERNSRHARSFPLPCLSQPRCNADVAGQRAAIAEPRQVPEFANQAGSSLHSDADNRGEKFAYLVRFKLSPDLTIDLIHSAAQQLDIPASIPHLKSVWLRVMMRY
jgi:hypothetical protein